MAAGKRRRNAARRLARSPRKSAKRRSSRKSRTMSISAWRKPCLPRVVRAIGWRIGVDMLGGNRGAHEKTAVVEIAAVKDLARDRIEERFRALGLLVVDQQRDVMALDLRPARIIDACAAEVLLQAGDRFGDPAVVEVDAVAGDVADRQPVAAFEIALCQPRAVAEQLVVAIEPSRVAWAMACGLAAALRRVNSSRPRPWALMSAANLLNSSTAPLAAAAAAFAIDLVSSTYFFMQSP